MEPIHRVTGPSGALDRIPGVHGLAPVDRDDRRPEERERRRRKPAPPAVETAVEHGDDGRPHIDVRA